MIHDTKVKAKTINDEVVSPIKFVFNYICINFILEFLGQSKDIIQFS